MAFDSASTPTIVEAIPFNGRTYWSFNGQDSDASTAIDIVAAPGAGKSLYITDIVMGSDDSDAHPHLQDGAAAVLFGPLMSTVEGPHIAVHLDRPIKVATNKSIAAKAAAAGNVFVFISGATADD